MFSHEDIHLLRHRPVFMICVAPLVSTHASKYTQVSSWVLHVGPLAYLSLCQHCSVNYWTFLRDLAEQSVFHGEVHLELAFGIPTALVSLYLLETTNSH